MFAFDTERIKVVKSHAPISEIVFSLAFITLKMADSEGIRKMITGMYSESRSISEFGEQKKSLFRRK